MAELQKREKAMMGIAVGCLLGFLVYQFVCTHDKGKPERLKQGAVAVPAQSATKKASTPVSLKKPLPQKPPAANVVASWRRDPFAEAYRLAPPDSSINDSTDFSLKGIIWQGGRALALIGHQILHEGEGAGDFRVLNIRRDRVTCKKGNRVITLFLE